MISVALPLWKARPIVWLALESLAAQQGAPPWELLVYEEPQGSDAQGVLAGFSEPLLRAGCVRILYLDDVPEGGRWPLGMKWHLLGRATDSDSTGMLLQAADCYSPPTRLAETAERLAEGFDWVFAEEGPFYDVNRGTLVMYRRRGVPTGLSMAMSGDLARALPEMWAKAGVDSAVAAAIKKMKPDLRVCRDLSQSGGLDVHGRNVISRRRGRMMSERARPFYALEKELSELVPGPIADRLRAMKNEDRP